MFDPSPNRISRKLGIRYDKVVGRHLHASLSLSRSLPSRKILKTMMNPILIFHGSIKSEVTANFISSVELIGLNDKSIWKFCSSILDDFVAFLAPSKRIAGSFQAELFDWEIILQI